VNTFPDVDQDLLRHPMLAERPSQRLANRPRCRWHHHPGADDEPGMVIDASDHLDLLAADEEHSTHFTVGPAAWGAG
jgi:hypothetical protein